MGSIFTNGVCKCEDKVKDNWNVVGKCRSRTGNNAYIVYCWKCQQQWRTKAKYVKELKGYK